MAEFENVGQREGALLPLLPSAEAIHAAGDTQSDDIVRLEQPLSHGMRAYDVTAAHRPFQYDELDTYYEPTLRTLWNYMNPADLPCYSAGLLGDMRQVQRDVHKVSLLPSMRYFVCASHAPKVFNLGGDLRLLARAVRRKDRGQLLQYGRACIDVLYSNYTNMNLPIVTLALVQGAALGGGFEAVMSFDLVVAERSAKFGLPEVLFNLFPGMGAMSLLVRRVGQKLADEIINSGRLYSAEELHALGLVDVVADDGTGKDVLVDLIKQTDRRFNSRQAIFAARRRVNRLDYEELSDIVTLWVDTALTLSESDLRKMERINSLQMRGQG